MEENGKVTPAEASDFTLVQVSDMHLSRQRPYFFHNWDVAVEWINANPPELVVNTGDMALHGADSDDDLRFVQAEHARLAAPVLAVPGNHDVGNNPPDRRGEPEVTEQRMARYAAVFGADRWLHDIGDWRLIGLNSLLMGSGLAAEHEQFEWLRAALAGAGGRRIGIFKHKPLFLRDAQDASMHQGSVFPAPRAPLLALLRQHRVALVANGHGHEFLLRRHGEMRCVWAPAIGFVTRDQGPSRGGGIRRVGLLQYRFKGGDFTVRRIELPAMLQIDISGWVQGGLGLYVHHATAPFRRPAEG